MTFRKAFRKAFRIISRENGRLFAFFRIFSDKNMAGRKGIKSKIMIKRRREDSGSSIGFMRPFWLVTDFQYQRR